MAHGLFGIYMAPLATNRHECKTSLIEFFGTNVRRPGCSLSNREGTEAMNNIVYIVGLVVIVIAVLSFFGLR
ncbi:hypothetical protein GGQ85_003930 [Nitrobacter vulgaris]|nr:hypothetical protein [Nitrobacter vulgaris]